MEYVFTMVSGNIHIVQIDNDISYVVKNGWMRLVNGEYINMDNVEFIRKKEDWE